MDIEVDPLEASGMRRPRSHAGTKLVWVMQQGMNARARAGPRSAGSWSSTHIRFLLLPLCLLGICVGLRTEWGLPECCW